MKTPFHGAVTLLVFLLAVICSYALAPHDLKLRIPRTNWSVPLSFCWVPWVAAVLLLIVQAITFTDVGTALAGDDGLRPSAVVVTYVSLAYLAVSCEITGLYAWLSLHVARWCTGARPALLLVAFFGLSGVLTAATGPDVSLIALTPMLVYAAGTSNLDPMAMAATHLGAASVWGMLVPVAGTVNIISSHAFQLSFTRFLGWMALPTCAATAVVFGLTYGLLHRRRPAPVRCEAGMAALPYPDPGVMLHDQVGAACSSALLVGCLLALLVAPWLRWSGWLVAAVFATGAAIYNLAASVGPLRAAIGRRSAYERRRRLQTELTRQGLHRLVSDEDLADLLLSAAQDRQASFTRLAAATASRVNAAAASAPLPPTASAGSLSSSYPSLPHWQSQSQSQSQQQLLQPAALARRPSAGGWSLGGGRRSSSSGGLLGGGGNGSLAPNLPSLASLGGGGSGFGAGVSPVRHWFSRRWSSLRGFSLPTGASSELMEAAADAGADLAILGQCGLVPLTSRATAAPAASGASPELPAAGPIVAAAAAAATLVGGGTSVGADGGAGSGSVPARVSGELHQLLTHGTSTAPDTLEWWAAAAMAAREMAGGRVGLAGGPAGAAATTAAAAVPPPVRMLADSLAHVDEDGCGSGSGAPGSRCSGRRSGSPWPGCMGHGGDRSSGGVGGSLTAESPFADPAVMWVQGWDGRLASASACWDCGGGAVDGTAGDVARPVALVGTSGCGGRGGGSGLTHAGGSHRRQRSHENASAAAKHRPRGVKGGQSSGDDPRDTCGAADCGGLGGGGDASGRWKGGCGGGGSGRWKGCGGGGGARAAAAGLGHPRQVFSEGGFRPSGAANSAALPAPQFAFTYPHPHPHPLPAPQRTTPVPPLPPPPSQPSPDVRPSSSSSSGSSPPPLRIAQASASSDGPGKDLGDDPAANDRGALLPLTELSDVAATRGQGCGCGWVLEQPSTIADGDAGAELLSTPPPQSQKTLPSPWGFESLFGCWRRDAVADGAAAESAALLPARAAASDDPRHAAQVPLPPLPPLPPASAGKQFMTARPAESTPRGASSSSDVSGHSCRGNGHGTAANVCRAATPEPPCTSSCRRSPFAFAVAGSGTGGRICSDSDGEGVEVFGGFGGGGGAGLAARCESFNSGRTASWGHHKLRRPSVALLMLGPNEVSFLGTFAALPWANTVFLLGWFVLVEALQVHGWLDSLARFLTAIAHAKDPAHLTSTSSTSLSSSADAAVASGSGEVATVAAAAAVFATGWLSVLLSLGMTGQSAALLLARVMMRPEFLAPATVGPAGSGTTFAKDMDPGLGRGASRGSAAGGGSGGGVLSAPQLGARLALVVAANMAPALSLSGSLIALRWGLGLRDLGVRMRCCKYMVSGLAPAAMAGTAAALLVLWAECLAWR